MGKPTKPDFEHIQQLALGLDLPEAEGDVLSPEEAAIRSEAARSALELAGVGDGAVSGFDKSGQPTAKADLWMQDYEQLRDAGWPWRVAAYIAWASCPKNSRWPKSTKELATQVLGLNSDRVIYKWRANNPAIDEVVATLQAAPLYAHRADIYAALITSATDADYKHFQDRRLALELMGDYVPRQVVDDRRSANDLEDLSSEDLRKIAGKMDADNGETDES